MNEKPREQVKITIHTRMRLDKLGCKGDTHDLILTRLIHNFKSITPAARPKVNNEGIIPAPLQKPLIPIRMTKITKDMLDLIGAKNERYEDVILRLIDCATG